MNEPAFPGLAPFYAMEMVARAKALEAAGRPVCHLEVGEPSAPPAPAVLDAVASALRAPQGYTHAMGRIELRRALAGYYLRRHGVEVDPETILVTMGSSSGFVLSFLSGFAPGAAIAVTRPGYPAYLNTLVALGLRPVEIPVRAENGWRLTAPAIVAAYRVQPFDGLLFASPANPTGATVSGADFAAIVAACADLGVRIISDEIYHGLEYGPPAPSALELTREAIVINSFSKYFCMTGWRIGWMIVPPDLVRRAEMLQQSLFIAAPTLSQIAGGAALGERDYYEAEKARYVGNGQLLAKGLAGLGFGDVRQPDGAFYAYLDVSRFSNDSMAFCRDLLDRAGVCITPGVDFDRQDGHNFVRLSYAGSEATIRAALEGIERFLG
jgi:aspartate/methionine/tyrosine aminotransferase